jgi:hypothetical protein
MMEQSSRRGWIARIPSYARIDVKSPRRHFHRSLRQCLLSLSVSCAPYTHAKGDVQFGQATCDTSLLFPLPGRERECLLRAAAGADSIPIEEDD